MNLNPVIVIGSPRSGTSVIARLLQENCDIVMDEGPIKTDWRNPQGYYEDSKLIQINNGAIRRWQIGQNHEQKLDLVWAAQFVQWVANRSAKYQDWGFKDPRLVGFIGWIKQFFNNPLWIYCIRSDKQIIKSQTKKFGFSKKSAIDGINAYRKLIKDNVKNYHLIDLTKRQSENILTQRLQTILGSR